MTKFKDIKFIHLNDPYLTERKPKEEFLSFEHEGERHPIMYDDISSVFVPGKGHIKPRKRSIKTTPALSDETNWNEYLQQYGKYCLFYALSGSHLNSQDCCLSKAQREFISIMYDGIEKNQSFINRFLSFHEFQLKEINKYEWTKWEWEYDVSKVLILPCFSIFIFPMPVSMDTVTDDEKLLMHCMLLEKKKGQDFKKFPICMRDRITYLFGEKASQIYESLLQTSIKN